MTKGIVIKCNNRGPDGNMMTKEQSEQLQADIITHCDGLDETLIDNLCQVVADYYTNQGSGNTTDSVGYCGPETETVKVRNEDVPLSDFDPTEEKT